LKGTREKKQVTYKGKLIRIIADFSKETLKARQAYDDIVKSLKENNCQP
jgi:hypothetical protein